MGRTATLVTSLVLGVLAVAARAAQEEAERPIHTRIDLPSLAACGECHGRVWDEWSRSLHARAWTNENVRRATKNFTIESCRACHSPEPVLETGLDRRPDYRDHNQLDGVHCLSCHGRADGVAASRTIPDAPCRPIEDARLRSVQMCFPCHEPTHQAFSEYYESQAYRDGVRCADCHMPERKDGGFSHGPNGGFSPTFVKKAIRWRASRSDGELQVRVKNRTGHKFPGEIPSRSFVVRAEFDSGEVESVLLRKPHKGEERQDDRLAPDELRTIGFAIPDAASSARVTLRFYSLPLLPDEDAFVLGEWSWTRE